MESRLSPPRTEEDRAQAGRRCFVSQRTISEPPDALSVRCSWRGEPRRSNSSLWILGHFKGARCFDTNTPNMRRDTAATIKPTSYCLYASRLRLCPHIKELQSCKSQIRMEMTRWSRPTLIPIRPVIQHTDADGGAAIESVKVSSPVLLIPINLIKGSLGFDGASGTGPGGRAGASTPHIKWGKMGPDLRSPCSTTLLSSLLVPQKLLLHTYGVKSRDVSMGRSLPQKRDPSSTMQERTSWMLTPGLNGVNERSDHGNETQ
ncbi:unnamed protein product [Pleuronectes platessa]|uniref:Uncharacterized protein n=1 Tax=Pleuronectes platessa TaxID=8262 RepID=A0A9N7USH5_PLEPL|nr:unnamed protein product [Pleuronectes platessa]